MGAVRLCHCDLQNTRNDFDFNKIEMLFSYPEISILNLSRP